MTSLSRTFLARVFAVVVVCQLLLVAWTYRQEHRAMEADLLAKVQLSTGLIGSASAKALLDFDVTNVGLLMDQALKDPDFVSVQLFDEKRYPVLERLGKGTHLHKYTYTLRRGVEVIGTIDTTYSTVRIHEELFGRVVEKVLAEAMVLLLLTFTIVYFFRKRVATRVQTIGAVIARATEGDLTARVDDPYRDELTTVAQGINYLVEQLRHAIVRIAALSGDVSTATNALLASFDEVNASMTEQQVSTADIFQAMDNLARSQGLISNSTLALHQFSEQNTAAVQQTMGFAQDIARQIEMLASGMHEAQSTMASIEATSRDLSRLASQAERNVDDALGSAGEMRTYLATVSGLISASAEQSERTTRIVSERGMPAFGEAERSMARIHTLSESLGQTIGNLGSGSKNIAKILAVISEVTERTKLLSLNASIIAAQSGEHGKGFMVVADEMKRLSDQTAQSTKEIIEILQGIQGGIAEAVKQARDASSTVQEGRGVISHAGGALQEILEASRESTTMVHEIMDTASLQQEHLGRILTTLDKLHQFNAGVTRAITDDLTNMSDFTSTFGELGSAMESARQATDEQVTTMQHIMENLYAATSQASDIATELSANESEGKIIAGAVGDVVEITERTTGIVADASRSILQVVTQVETLTGEMNRFTTE